VHNCRLESQLQHYQTVLSDLLA